MAIHSSSAKQEPSGFLGLTSGRAPRISTSFFTAEPVPIVATPVGGLNIECLGGHGIKACCPNRHLDVNTEVHWLVVWNIFIFPYIWEYSQLTFIFFRGVGIPPSRYSTPNITLNILLGLNLNGSFNFPSFSIAV
jgi:hypothetical protein